MIGRHWAAQRSCNSVIWENCASLSGCELPESFLWLTRSEKPLFLSSPATVRALTWVPRDWSSVAILAVVRRVHFRPLIGSPAVSCFMIASILWNTSGVFFGYIRNSQSLDLHVIKQSISIENV